jgi:hypothetical protein
LSRCRFLSSIALAEFGAKQLRLWFGHIEIHALLARLGAQRDDFLQGRGTLQDGDGLLAESGIKPDSGLNRKIGSMEAGEHISKRLWFHQSYHSAKASPSGESFEKHLLLVIGHFLFSIAH